MTKDTIDINKTVQEVEALLAESHDLPPALEASINMLLLVVKLFVDRSGLNRKNSSKPPSSDPNREKNGRSKSEKPRGGQKGHNLLRRSRQKWLVQHSMCASIKANAVYMSMFQLIPYERIQTHFDELFDIPISTGSLVNFNADAYQRLDVFEVLAIKMLRHAEALHADETGINVDGKRLWWLHGASNDKWTLLAAHAKRGKDAMDEINILPHFSGLLIHDHWKPY